jgi:hypothetical protein
VGRGGRFLKSYVTDLFADPGFVGSFLGAFLSGAIALSLLIYQIREQKKLVLAEKYQSFLKRILPLSIDLQSYLNRLNDNGIDFILNKKDSIKLKLLTGQTKDINERIKLIDSDFVLYDVYLQFETIKMVVQEIEEILCTEIEDIIDEADRDFVRSSLLGNIKILRKSASDVENKLADVKEFLKFKE